jgi:hypothetical protein
MGCGVWQKYILFNFPFISRSFRSLESHSIQLFCSDMARKTTKMRLPIASRFNWVFLLANTQILYAKCLDIQVRRDVGWELDMMRVRVRGRTPHNEGTISFIHFNVGRHNSTPP